MNNLTIEQMQKIHKLQKGFIKKSALLTFLYLTGLFMGNIVIAMIGLSYMKAHPAFIDAATFGSAIIVLIGLRFEVEKAYSKMKSEIKKISNS